MCEIITTALTALGSVAGGTTAAGAAAGAATAGTGLSILGTGLAVGGSLLQGYQNRQASRAQARMLEQQARDERSLAAVKEQRTRAQFRTAMRQQMAELSARGISINSPTAVLLGQTAAQEMSFDSQAIRSGGAARYGELSSSAIIARNRGTSAMLKGGFDAAGSFLTSAPGLWPELLS
ncbi:MAG: hypothetical protein ACU0FT_04220 [Paracoccus sp. (in: a-proteobacteria)]|uniref:hypothetical protein n=1 Tax=Paracoccus sp. TaxID=267 RepID=UPI004057D766